MVDIFARLEKNAGGPIGQYMRVAHGYFAFPKLEGELGPHMRFRGKMMLNWSLNNYLGLANHPEVREADARGAAEFGMAAPMGARMMSGQTKYHEQLERELAAFVGKEDAFLLNFGYQGMISIIDCPALAACARRGGLRCRSARLHHGRSASVQGQAVHVRPQRHGVVAPATETRHRIG